MTPKYERLYGSMVRRRVRVHRWEEKQRLEPELPTLLAKRGAEHLKSSCPPIFAFDCILEDGSRCQHYSDGVCLKAEEVAE